MGSATRTPGTSNSSSASNLAYCSRTLRAECEMKPSPRHSKYGRSCMVSPMTLSATGLPSHGTTRAYWFSISARSSDSCCISM